MKFALVVLVGFLLCTRRVEAQRFPIPIPGQNRAPTPYELSIARGDRALGTGDLATARREFETAATQDTRDARAPFYLGEIAMRQNRWEDAERHFRAATTLNPRMGEAFAELGVVLRERGNVPQAITALETAVRLAPTLPEPHLSLGMIFEEQAQRERALQEYRSAVRLDAQGAQAPLLLGTFLARERPAAGTQPRAEAFRMLQGAVRNAPSDRAVLSSAGPALRLLGEHTLAVDVLERALRAGAPDAGILTELAQAQWAAGNRSAALQRSQEAIAAGPNNAEAHYIRALLLGQTGDLRGARTMFERTVQLAANTPLAERARARLQALPNR